MNSYSGMANNEHEPKHLGNRIMKIRDYLGGALIAAGCTVELGVFLTHMKYNDALNVAYAESALISGIGCAITALYALESAEHERSRPGNIGLNIFNPPTSI